MSEKIIEMHGIVKEYQKPEKHCVLNELELLVNKGEFVTVMGKSGTGKSTLLHVLGLMDRADSGLYEFCGVNIANMTDKQLSSIRNSKIGFVFQAFHLIPKLTVFENIALPLVVGRVSPAQRKKRVEEMMELVGLQDKSKHKPAMLSGGQCQRVAIARALVNRADLLLADEPTGNLDIQNSESILEMFQKINEERNTTILLVTHQIENVQYGQRSLYFKDGKVYES